MSWISKNIKNEEKQTKSKQSPIPVHKPSLKIYK